MDKIDEVAFVYAKENGTLGQDYNQIYDGVKYGYQRGRQETIDRACEWMKTAFYIVLMNLDGNAKRATDVLVEQFKKEMENE